MRSILKYFAVPAACLLLSLPVRSAVPDTEVQTPLNTLLQELRQSYTSALESDSLLVNNGQRQEEIARMLKSADEVTVMLYTQRPEFAFDMAFALEYVSGSMRISRSRCGCPTGMSLRPVLDSAAIRC